VTAGAPPEALQLVLYVAPHFAEALCVRAVIEVMSVSRSAARVIEASADAPGLLGCAPPGIRGRDVART